MSIPSVVVVIPIWNKSEETVRFAIKARDSVLKYTDRTRVDLRLVLVDNASPCSEVWTTNCDWDLVLLKKNRGFGPAVNLGAKVHPDTDYVCQINSDAELVEDSINILIDAMNEHGLDVGMPEHYDACKLYGLEKTPTLMLSDWRFGAFWVMRRAMWDSVGGFDEAFEMFYSEDSDLWKRVESIGGIVAGYRGTWVKHIGGASSHPDRDFYFEKNRKLFEERWGKK